MDVGSAVNNFDEIQMTVQIQHDNKIILRTMYLLSKYFEPENKDHTISKLDEVKLHNFLISALGSNSNIKNVDLNIATSVDEAFENNEFERVMMFNDCENVVCNLENTWKTIRLLCKMQKPIILTCKTYSKNTESSSLNDSNKEEKKLMTMELRPYQVRVANDIGERNTIVKMPTGSGKTLVAAEVMKNCLEKYSIKKGLFLVPTCDLVSQQAKVLQEWTKRRISEYMGNKKVPSINSFDILVSTPEAFRLLQIRDNSFEWNIFKVCVFDEVHHVLKDHPYRFLAHGIRSYVQQNHSSIEEERGIQIIGLSASLTYAVGQVEVQKALVNLTRDLMMEEMISVSDDELRTGGYNPPQGDVEISHPSILPEGIVPQEDRQPHLMHFTFFERSKLEQLTKVADHVLKVVKGLELFAGTNYYIPRFESPLKKVSLCSWENFAYKLAVTFPEKNRFLYLLETWYVALRILVQTWEEEEELILNWLVMSDAFLAKQFLSTNSSGSQELNELERLSNNPFNMSKIACLKGQLIEKKQLFGADFRCIVFVQQRITAHVLSHYINNNSELQHLGLLSDYVAARNTKITPRIKVTPSSAKDCIKKFRTGELNVIVATSVIEEGFDVPAANVVISFDHLKDTVELAQRFGRARQEDRRIVVMDQRHDRPISRLEEVRMHQDKQIAKFIPSDAIRDLAAEKTAQENRERNFRELLHTPFTLNNVLQTLKEYVKKTKAIENEHVCKDKSTNEWLHVWTYSSVLRKETAQGRGQSKVDARRVSASKLLLKLRG